MAKLKIEPVPPSVDQPMRPEARSREHDDAASVRLGEFLFTRVMTREELEAVYGLTPECQASEDAP